MKFTEREMTVAVEAVARRTFEALPKLLRKRAGAASWEEMSKGARYQHLVTAGDVVLPGLTALPERPTVGATPEFSPEEYVAAAEQARSGAKRREVLAAAALLKVAVGAMPLRQDPDALIVPDHL